MNYLHLNLGWNCNNNCITCPEYREKTKKIISKSEILEKIKKIKNMKKLFITGGEPTIHPNFFGILKEIKKKDPKIKITLLSNGRMFSYPSFIEKIKEYNINTFYISLYGTDSKTHDSITRCPGSFRQTIQGINNLIKNKKRVTTSMVINKLLYEDLDKDSEKFIKNFIHGPPLFRFRLVNIVGEAEKFQKILNIKFSKIWPDLQKLLDFLIERKIKFKLDNMMPYCLIPKRYHQFIAQKIEGKQTLINFNDSHNKIIIDYQNPFIYIEKCKDCVYIKDCKGINSFYLKYNSLREFKK